MKPPVIIAIVAVISILGIAAFAMMSKKTATTTIDSNTSITVDDGTEMLGITGTPPAGKMAPSGISSFTGKLSDLFTRSESQQCTLKADNSTQTVNGTYYISNGRVRGEMSTGETGMQMNMILKDNTMYYWSEKPVPFGFKTTFKELEAQATTMQNNPSTAQASELITKDQAFDCTAWSLDESKFTLPTNITFSAMAQ